MFSTGAGAEAEGEISGGVYEPGLGADTGPEEEAAFGEGGYSDGVREYPDGGFEAEPDPEPFFGMQSEGMALTGLALGPGLRRAARVCVAVALGLGVVLWAILAVLYAYRVFFEATANPDMPHLGAGRLGTAYYLVGALWAVGVGAFGLATRGSMARLLWCFGCLVGAFFWPLGVAASLALMAWRGRAAVSRRAVLAGVAVLIAVAGMGWRLGVAPTTSAKAVAVGSDGDLLGTWRSRSGMSVDLRPDGIYEASALSGGGLGDGDGVPASSGRWDSEGVDGHTGVRLQVDGDLSHSLVFDVYKAGPDLLLCSTSEPDKPCQVVLRRS